MLYGKLPIVFLSTLASEKKDSTNSQIATYLLNHLDDIKDIGIQEILQYYNLDVSQIMAFGDGDNDVKMLEIAGIAVAMGNGNENVKAVADYVTDDIDQDGIANALYHYGIFHETLIK